MKSDAGYPSGCGHRCTVVLSPQFLDERYLTGDEQNKARSSHNTFMTLLVEQGIPGVVFYLLLLAWIIRKARTLARAFGNTQGSLPLIVATAAAVLAAVTIGDLFVDYLKAEVRIWFIAVVMVLENMNAAVQSVPAADRVRLTQPARDRKDPRGTFPGSA